MYYFLPLCVAVMLCGSVALGGCNDTCSSILAGKSSGNFDVDCNAGITTDYFKCISAISGCDNITKSTIAEQSIAKYYPSISCAVTCVCGYGCICWISSCWWWKRSTNETAPLLPLISCFEDGTCACNNKGEKHAL